MKKLVIVALIISLFFISMSTSFVAVEFKHAGKYTFQAEGYTIEYVLPYDASFYPENYRYGPSDWGAEAYGWELFSTFFEDDKERKLGVIGVYQLNKSYWQEWQRKINGVQVSPSKNFDEFVDWFDKLGDEYKTPYEACRETTASGYEVIILEDYHGDKSFWIRIDDDNGFVIEAGKALCIEPYPPRDCSDPKLFWQIVDEFVQNFKVAEREPTPTPSLTIKPTSTPTPEPPGFETVFAIAGLLAVAYLVLRRMK